MEGVLAAMSSVRLYVLPDTSPWTLDLFVHNTWLTCCQAAQVGSNEHFYYIHTKETPLLYTSFSSDDDSVGGSLRDWLVAPDYS